MRIAFFTNALVGAIVVAVIAAVIYYRMHKPAAGMPEPTPGIEVVDTSVPQIPDQEGSIVVVEKGQPPSGETFSPTGSGVQIGSATDILDTSSAVAIQDGGTGTDSAAVGESTQSVAVVVATNTTSLLDAVSAIEPGLHVVETGAETNVSATPDYVEYAVRSGDSLWGIARKHNMSFLALLTLNQIGSNVVLKVGQKLKVNRVDEALTAIGATGTSTVVRLPVGASVESRTTAGVEYRVKAKETYFSISRTFGCSVQALQTLNSNVMLKAGDTIRIPAKP